MFEQIIEVIKKSSNIAITFHVSPDGDSIGSSLALMMGLRKLGKKVNVVSKENSPETFNFLPKVEEINSSLGTLPDDIDCLIVLDCGNVERINCILDSSPSRKYILINMDHHLSNDYYGDINFVETSYCAMGEMIYQLLETMNIIVDSDISVCLYTSIITDCGSFKYSNTTALTHRIAGDLISRGIDFTEIHRKIYENKKFATVKLAGKLIENMYLEYNNKICIMEMKKSMLDELSIDPSDVSDLVTIGTEIEGVEVVVFIKENSGKHKVSLRSKTELDVRKIAEYYGGGGHSKASGFSYSGNLEDLKKEIIRKIGDCL